jgi:hypothetical protein
MDWSWPVAQPVADDLFAVLEATTWAGWSNEQVVQTRWRLDPDVVQELVGPPGQTDPATIGFRRTRGLGGAATLTTAAAAAIGACDGELTLGQIIVAVAQLLEVDRADTLAEVLPVARHLIGQAWLRPAQG